MSNSRNQIINQGLAAAPSVAGGQIQAPHALFSVGSYTPFNMLLPKGNLTHPKIVQVFLVSCKWTHLQ